MGSRTLSDGKMIQIENFPNWTELDYVVDRKLDNIHSDANGVEKYLYFLNPHKTPGPD